MARLLANPSVKRTPGKLRLPVPFVLRAPVARLRTTLGASSEVEK